MFETPPEPNLVEAGLSTVDERAGLVCVPDLRVRLHRLLAPTQLGEDLTLFVPSLGLDVARLTDLDRPIDELERLSELLFGQRPTRYCCYTTKFS